MITKKIGSVIRKFDVCPVCGRHIATCAIKSHINHCQQIFAKKIEIKNFNPKRSKYYKTYCKLIEKRLNNKLLDGYYETHHIIPKCVGGSNNKSNLIRLTAKEHFVAHLLLAEMFRYTSYYGKLLRALNMMMSTRDVTNSKKYEKYRIEFAKQRSQQMSKNNSMKNKKWIFNIETGETILIDRIQLEQYDDKKWHAGKFSNYKKKLILRSENHKKRLENVKNEAEKLYKEYRKLGWKKFNEEHPGHAIQYWTNWFIRHAKSYSSMNHANKMNR